jgi:hypothetical protein
MRLLHSTRPATGSLRHLLVDPRGHIVVLPPGRSRPITFFRMPGVPRCELDANRHAVGTRTTVIGDTFLEVALSDDARVTRGATSLKAELRLNLRTNGARDEQLPHDLQDHRTSRRGRGCRAGRHRHNLHRATARYAGRRRHGSCRSAPNRDPTEVGSITLM